MALPSTEIELEVPKRNLFYQTIYLAQGLRVVKLDQVVADGTKIKAYAAMRYSRMRKRREGCMRISSATLSKYEETDEWEDTLYGVRHGEKLPPKLAMAEKRLKVIREAMAALKKEAQEKAKRE